MLAGHCVANRIKARSKVYIIVPFWNWTKPFEWLNWSDMLYPSKIFWWSNIFRSSHGHGVFISWELCDVWKITASLMVFEGCDNWLYDGAAIIIEQTLLAGHHQGEEKIIQNQHSLLQWKLPPHQAMQVTVFWIISILKVLPKIDIAEFFFFLSYENKLNTDFRLKEARSLMNQTIQSIILTGCAGCWLWHKNCAACDFGRWTSRRGEGVGGWITKCQSLFLDPHPLRTTPNPTTMLKLVKNIFTNDKCRHFKLKTRGPT